MTINLKSIHSLLNRLANKIVLNRLIDITEIFQYDNYPCRLA